MIGTEVEEVLAAVLAGEPVDAVVDRIARAAVRDLPGSRVVVVAARSGPARVHGRSLDLPRRVVLALDRVATGAPARPDGSPGIPLPGATTVADLAVAPWADAAPDLEEAGLGAPSLVSLVEREVLLGVLAAFPPAPAAGVGAPTAALSRWATVAAVALARAADGHRLRQSTLEHDATGLPNESTVMARLREALHRRPRRPMALIQVTLDRMDALEDGLVGAQGDALLRAAGERLRAVIRPGDMVGHLRGSSFAVICDDVGPDEATEVGERVRLALAQPISVGDHDIATTPGIGVVVATELDTVNSLTHKAGIAARESASSGGSEVVRYRPGTYEAAVARIDLERDLRRALSGDGLRLAYQPQVSLQEHSRLVGAEALVRWDSPQGPISPEVFIPVAEETGLVVELGGWALDTAVAALAGPIATVGVSVNVSARQLDDPGLLERVDVALGRHGIDPARLCLEITESALVRDVERSAALLRRLHRRGVRISIDDFGTGYASLEHLRQVDVAETLKIDRTFVAGLVHDARDRAIVAAAVTLGRTLGFTVVAEGVEHADQARLLAEMGCDAAQGYLFGEAVTAEELASWHPPIAP